MKKVILNVLKYSLGVGLGVFLLWLAFRGINMDELKEKLTHADYYWVLWTVPIALLSHFLRAVRWRMLIIASDQTCRTSTTFASLMVGYLVNQAIPRGGEIARCTMLTRNDKVPLSVSMGTVLIERVFDVIVLLLLVLFFLVMESERLMGFFSEVGATITEKLNLIGTASLLLAGLVPILGAVGFYFFWKRMRNGPLFTKIREFFMQMFVSAKSIFRLKSPLSFIALTIGIWICYGLTTWMAFLALPESAHFSVYFGFLVMTMGGIGMSMPAPGGIGPFHAAVKYTIVAFYSGIMLKADAEALGIALGVIMHTTQLILMVISGFVAWIFLSVQKHRVA